VKRLRINVGSRGVRPLDNGFNERHDSGPAERLGLGHRLARERAHKKMS
jgi:hypothetical protein